MAKEHAELLRACPPMATLSAGHTARTGSSARDFKTEFMESIRPQNSTYRKPGRIADIARFSKAATLMERRFTALRSTPSVGPKASQWASPTRFTLSAFEYENPDKPYDLEGFVNSAGAVGS